MVKKINLKGEIVSNETASWVKKYYPEYECVSPQDVIENIDEEDDIELVVNSPGGSVYAASEIYTAIKNHAKNVEVQIVGLAASAASWIACAGDKVKISPTGLIMVHNSSSYAWGDYRDMDTGSNMLKSIDTSIRNAYRLKTGLKDEEIKDLMDKTSWIDPVKAMEYKLVDEIMFDNGELNPAKTLNSLMIPIETLKQNMVRSEKVENKVKQVDDKKVEEAINITKEYLIENYKDIYDEILEEGKNLGIKEERERIREIEDLGIKGADEIINKAKFDEIKNASEVAVEIIKNQKSNLDLAAKNIKEDKKDVKVDTSNSIEESNKEEDAVNFIAAGMGGK